jgi:hypothetical protein
MISESTAHFGGGPYAQKRYAEFLHPHVENRTKEEIIEGMKAKLEKLGGE